MTPRKTALTIGVVAAAGLAVGTVAAVNDTNDPTEAVGLVDVARSPGDTTAPPAQDAAVAQPTTTAATTTPTTPDASTTTEVPAADPGQSRQVAALDELKGPLRWDDDRDEHDDDADDFSVNGIDLDFGPDGWLLTAGPLEDFDRDGSVENVRDELQGLVGQEVTLLVRFDDDDEADVYVIDNLTFRDSSTGNAPWETDDDRAESRQRATDAAMAAVENAAHVDDVDRNGDGSWDVEVVDDAGREHDVRVSAEGAVLRIDPDDLDDHDDHDDLDDHDDD